MAYSTKASVQTAAGGSQRLLDLSDLENEGAINDAVVTAAITATDDWINSFAQKRYATPLTPVTGFLAQLAADETVYRLQVRRGMVTQDARDAHDERERWLTALSKGLVSPGVEPSPPKSSAVAPETFDRASVDGMTRDSLKGYW